MNAIVGAVILPRLGRAAVGLGRRVFLTNGWMRWVYAAATTSLLAAPAQAHRPALDVWEINISPYAIHFTQTSEHRHVYAVALQRVDSNGDLAGASLFSNSFGQPSAYGFIGRKYVEPWGIQSTYVQWTAGVLYGYKGKYKNKVPLNANGLSPGFIPSVGYQISRHSSLQLTFLGNSALMFNWTLTVH
jgi:hypothetical protein